MSVLLVETGPLRGKRFRLPQKGTIGIGRDPKCAIQLADPMASRVHCVLRLGVGECVLEDQKSLNRTFVNQELIERHVLADGDTIRIGDTLLSFSAQQDDPLLQRTIGGCRIEARIGRGAMGTVYRAHQLSVDRPVALKILAPHLVSDAAFTRKFLDEARAAARLNHPNIVQVYDAGREGDLYYISMEYLEGGSLQELLDREGKLEPSRAVAMAVDAAQALSYAAERGIVHRDIKPANLFLSTEGTVKVGDLGIAADLRSAETADAGKSVGSPRYMAPEQIRGEALDHRADIYALGGTLYRAIAGVPPFEGTSVTDILKKKLEGEAAPLRQHCPDVSPALAAVVHRMLARDPEARYASAADAAQALDRALDRPAATRLRRTRVVRRRQTSNSGVIVGVCSVAVLFFFVILIAKMRSDDGPRSPGSAASRVPAPVEPVPVPVEPAAPRLKLAPERATAALVRKAGAAEEEAPAAAAASSPSVAQREAAEAEARRRQAELEEEERKAVASALAEVTRSALEAVSRLDFTAADSAIVELERQHPVLKASVEPLRTEVTSAGAAWSRLAAALAERRKDRKAVALSFPPSPLEPTAKPQIRQYLVVEAAGPCVRLQAAASRDYATRCILAAESEGLLALAAGTATPDAELRSGLGLLLALCRGPDAGKALLLSEEASAPRRQLREQALEQARGTWFPARESALQGWAAERRPANPPAPADAWELIADEAAELLQHALREKRLAGARKELRSLFLEARTQALAAAPPAAFLHAREVKVTKEGVELTYDFSAREQLEDFIAARGLSTTLEWVKPQKSLKLGGEVRFLEGDPFLGRIGVAARATALDAKAPNVNLALWTRAGHVLTPRAGSIRLDRWRDGGGADNFKDDVFVLGMGYLFEVDLEQAAGRRWGQLARGLRAFLPVYLREPALAILAAPHGTGLHSDPAELIWESPSATVIKGPFAFAAALDERGELQWTINRRAVPFQGSAGLKRLGSDTPRRGSFSLFTNGGTVLISQLRVTGQIDPGWIAARAKALAEADLKKLEGASGESLAPPTVGDSRKS